MIISEPLKEILSLYCHIEYGDLNDLNNVFLKEDKLELRNEVKSQLKNSILNLEFSYKDFNEITDDELENNEELIERLFEVWSHIFIEEQI